MNAGCGGVGMEGEDERERGSILWIYLIFEKEESNPLGGAGPRLKQTLPEMLGHKRTVRGSTLYLHKTYDHRNNYL